MKHKLVLWGSALALTLCITVGHAKEHVMHQQNKIPAQTFEVTAAADQTLAFQQRLVELELKKLSLQYEQMQLEHADRMAEQARLRESDQAKSALKTWLPTTTAIFIPLILGVLTLAVQARAQFSLKAAEFLMSSNSPGAAKGRLELLHALFGPWVLSKRFDNPPVDEFPGTVLRELQILLFNALLENKESKQFVLDTWESVFGPASLKRMEEVRGRSRNPKSAAPPSNKPAPADA